MKSRVLRGLPVPKQAPDGPAASPRLPYMQHAHHALPPSAILKNPFRRNASFATFCKRMRHPASLTGCHQAKKAAHGRHESKTVSSTQKAERTAEHSRFQCLKSPKSNAFPSCPHFFLMLLRVGLEPATSGAKIWERESDGSGSRTLVCTPSEGVLDRLARCPYSQMLDSSFLGPLFLNMSDLTRDRATGMPPARGPARSIHQGPQSGSCRSKPHQPIPVPDAQPATRTLIRVNPCNTPSPARLVHTPTGSRPGPARYRLLALLVRPRYASLRLTVSSSLFITLISCMAALRATTCFSSSVM